VEALRERWPEGRGLRVHRHRDAASALSGRTDRTGHPGGARVRRRRLDGFELLLRRERAPEVLPGPPDLAGRPRLRGIGERPIALEQHDRPLDAA